MPRRPSRIKVVPFTDIELDDWVVGEGVDSADHMTYVIHLAPPRFVVRYVVEGEAPAGARVLHREDGWAFFGIVWFDLPPPKDEHFPLLKAAAAAVARHGM